MKNLNQLVLILVIWSIGEYISSFIQSIITIPGSIIGMILLFILLQFKIIKLNSIENISELLLDNMPIFFIPSGVSLIKSLNLIADNLIILVLSIVIGTIIVMYVTGYVVQRLINRSGKDR